MYASYNDIMFVVDSGYTVVVPGLLSYQAQNYTVAYKTAYVACTSPHMTCCFIFGT